MLIKNKNFLNFKLGIRYGSEHMNDLLYSNKIKFIHSWIHFDFPLKCPKIWGVSISVRFLFLTWSRAFRRNAPLFLSDSENGAFQGKLKLFEFLGISGKNQNVITWIISPSHAFWGISRYVPYYWIDECIFYWIEPS